jgi:hypothetical protein
MSANQPLKIVNTDRLSGNRLLVSYSDDTTSIYTAEQLVNLASQTTSNQYIDHELPQGTKA